MPTVTVDDAGTYLYYEDSGAPPNSDNYATVFLYHGFSIHTPIFRPLFPHAAKDNLRLIAITVRGYPNSSPLTDSEVAVGASTSVEDVANFVFLLAKELALAIASIIKTENIPPPTEIEGVKSGGAHILAWSAGVAFLASLLANFSSLPEDLQALLQKYITSVVIHDPPSLGLGIFKPMGAFSPLEDPEIALSDRIPRLVPWISGYFEPLNDLQSITSEALEQRKDMSLLFPDDLKYQPTTTTRMTAEEVEASTYYGVLMRNPTPFSPTVILDVYGPNTRRALFDTKGVWKGLSVLILWTDMGVVYCTWAARALYDMLEAPVREGEERRDIKIVKLENANHYVHVEDPERMINIISDHIKQVRSQG